MDNNLQNEHLSERSLVYCISPPGENEWVKESHNVNSGKIINFKIFYNASKYKHFFLDPLIDRINNLEIKEPNQIAAKKFPLPNKSHTSTIIKFYNDMAESIKVGQLIEVIGILGQDMSQQQNDQTELDSALDLFSDIPVLHAIAFNNLNAINSLPFRGNVTHEAKHIRAQLIDYISSALGNDTLAAEFVLLQLLSRV